MPPKVALIHGVDAYPDEPPFHPDRAYPEYPFAHKSALGPRNPVYAAVREGFRLLGLDAEHVDTPQWNPLGDWISPGQRVVLNPNFVHHENESGDSLYAVITHPAVLRAIADYAYLALRGEGDLCIADAPQGD